jgi:large subunit ribosomal protein L25
MELSKVTVYKRDDFGKNANNKLRESGMIPGVLYGKKQETVSVKLNPKVLVDSLNPIKKRNTFFELAIENGETTTCIIKDVQIDHLTDGILHVDFLRINADDQISVKIPFTTTGTAIGVKLGGRLRHIVKALPIRCAASIIPDKIEVDITEMELRDVVRVEDITPPEGVVIEMSSRQSLVDVASAKIEEVEETEEGEEGEEEATTEEVTEEKAK